MSRNEQTTSRLWPVLLTLAVMPVGAHLLESMGRARSRNEKVIKVDAPRQEDAEDLDVIEEAPVDPDHVSARDAVRRGDLQTALAGYEGLSARYPASTAIALERASAMVAAKKPAEAIALLVAVKERAPQEERVAVLLARAHLKQKDLPAAEAELRRALNIRPAYSPALRTLGRVLADQGRTPEAIEVLTQASQFGGNEERAIALVALGGTLLDDKRPDDARVAFDRAIERAPARVEVRLGIARAYLATDAREDATKASGILAVAADLAPDLPDVQTLIGQARETLGDLDGADEAYWQALRLAPQATFARRRLLRIALQRQRFAKAQQHVDELLAIDADDPEHHFLAGLVAARSGRAAEARTHYLVAIDKAQGNYPEAFLNLGAVEKDDGKLDAAIAAYQKAIELRPGYHAAENNLGLALSAAGRADDAERLYKSVLARTPSYAPAWLNLGKLYSQRKEYPAAIDAYLKALDARPDYPRALLDLGVAYARSGKLDDAEASYRKVLALNPRSVSAWYNLALIQLQRSDAKNAEASLRQALTLDGEHINSERKLAALLVARGALPEAGALYDDVLDSDPHDADARLGRAEMLRTQGDKAGCARDATFAARDAQDAAAKGRELLTLDGRAVAPLAAKLVDNCK